MNHNQQLSPEEAVVLVNEAFAACSPREAEQKAAQILERTPPEGRSVVEAMVETCKDICDLAPATDLD